MFEIKVADRDATGGSTPIAWCVDAATIKQLADAKLVSPQVVIVVAPVANYRPYKEYRKVVPLRDLMAYVEFQEPGTHRIFAFIAEEDGKEARERFLRRGAGGYDTSILHYDGDDWSHRYDWHRKDSADGADYYSPTRMSAPVLKVNVPTNIFAKEPAQWEKTWVNHWYSTSPDNQCAFRRRRMVAYTIQPIVFLLDVLVLRTIMLLVAFFYLSRGLSFQYHLHPITYNVEATATGLFVNKSWVFPSPQENEEVSFLSLLRKFILFPLLPPFAAIMIFFVVIHHALLALGVLLFFYAIVLLLASAISGLLGKAVLDAMMWVYTRVKGLQPEKPKELWYLDADEIDAITCNPAFNNRASVSDLPAKHRTIRLYYQDLKAKVCRPFAQ